MCFGLGQSKELVLLPVLLRLPVLLLLLLRFIEGASTVENLATASLTVQSAVADAADEAAAAAVVAGTGISVAAAIAG